MSAPPTTPADRVTIPVKLRPKLAAMITLMAADQGLTERQLIAAVMEDLAMRGATSYGKRHILVIHRRPRPPAGKQEANA